MVNEFEKWFKKKYGISLFDLDNAMINTLSEEDFSKHSSEDVDPEALAFIKAKNKVTKLQKARKQEKFQ